MEERRGSLFTPAAFSSLSGALAEGARAAAGGGSWSGGRQKDLKARRGGCWRAGVKS
jgi:hypothetical protein